MNGKVVVSGIAAITALAGAAMYYLQVHAYFEPVEDTGASVQLTTYAGTVEPVLYGDFEAIDAESSPLRYRACFTTDMSLALLTETYEIYERPTAPVTAGWFDCFDAAALDAALSDGSATAFLSQGHIEYGIDRIAAVFDDGRGMVWHQINNCGKEHFDGNDVPADCPRPPQDN